MIEDSDFWKENGHLLEEARDTECMFDMSLWVGDSHMRHILYLNLRLSLLTNYSLINTDRS